MTLDEHSFAQFSMDKQIDAAKLLCNAGVNSLIWGGHLPAGLVQIMMQSSAIYLKTLLVSPVVAVPLK